MKCVCETGFSCATHKSITKVGWFGHFPIDNVHGLQLCAHGCKSGPFLNDTTKLQLSIQCENALQVHVHSGNDNVLWSRMLMD